MRLGLYIPVLDDRPAGVGVYIEEVCGRLARRFPGTVVFTGSPRARRDWLQGARVIPLGGAVLPVARGLQRRARRLAWLGTTAGSALRRHGVEVLFSPVQEGPLASPVPTVVVMHDLTALRYPEAYDHGTVAQTRWLLPWMLRRAAQVVAVSESTRRDVLQTFKLRPDRVTVVGEGCDRSVFHPRPETEVVNTAMKYGLSGRYLLYAGTLSRHKNLGLVVEALARLGPAAADVHLALVGRGDVGVTGELEALVGRLGLQHRVHHLGYVPRVELAALMGGAACFVYPSRYEGFGLAPLEAMACGVPVVASAVSSLPEVVGSGGVLVASAEPAAWAAGLDTALALDPAAARQAACAQAARFDWDLAVDQLAALLGRVATGAVSPT